MGEFGYLVSVHCAFGIAGKTYFVPNQHKSRNNSEKQ